MYFVNFSIFEIFIVLFSRHSLGNKEIKIIKLVIIKD